MNCCHKKYSGAITFITKQLITILVYGINIINNSLFTIHLNKLLSFSFIAKLKIMEHWYSIEQNTLQ
jgi:hypothetical protein